MEREDSQQDIRRSGRAIRERAQGAKAEALGQVLHDLDPALLEWSDSFIFGTVWTREGLAHEERMLIAIAALASLGHTAQLRNYLHGALQDGMPAEKVHETLMMLCIYAGFPAALSALHCWHDVLRAHDRNA